MDPISILAEVQLAIKLAQMAYDLGHDAAPFVKTAYEIVFKNKVLTVEERQAMTAQETSWRASTDKIIAEDDAATD
jgi:hypothetical protein